MIKYKPLLVKGLYFFLSASWSFFDQNFKTKFRGQLLTYFRTSNPEVLMKLSFLLYFILFDFLALCQCPTINLHPKSQTDCDGNSIRMICQATAGSSFQWERKRPQDGVYSPISGANLNAYQIFPSGDANSPTGTLYRVKVALNSCTIYSQAAEITLTKISSILNPSICERGTGVLEVQMPWLTHMALQLT